MVPSVLWLAVVWAWGVLLAPTPTLAADEPLPFAVLVTYLSRTGNTDKMARSTVERHHRRGFSRHRREGIGRGSRIGQTRGGGDRARQARRAQVGYVGFL